MVRASWGTVFAAVAVALSVPCGAQSWSLASPAAAPSARNSSGLAYDETTGTALLFGGYDLGALGDTWLWNGATWLQVTTPVAPPARWSHSLVFDRSRRCYVLFGGFDPSSGLLADTWEFDGSAWTQRAASAAPPPRLAAAMAFDRDRGRTVLFGGQGGLGQLQNDTWEWDGVAWSERAVGTAPSARAGAVATFDSVRRQTVLFGGAANGVALADTWLWNGSAWTQALAASGPSARRDATAAFDVVRNEVVLFGGADANWANNFGDTWTWDGSTWALASAGTSPRHGAAMAYDAQRGTTMLFGGRDGTSFLADAWLRPSVPTTPAFEWTRVATGGLQPRINGAIAFDEARGETVVFGGWVLSGPGWYGGGSSTSAAVGAGGAWNGTTWRPTPASFVRAYPAMAYDSARQRVVLFGGRFGSYPNPWQDQAETWEWDGVVWAQSAVVGPPARSEHAMAYDSARGVIVLFGGSVWNGPTYDDTWEFDGTTWTQRNPASTPGARRLAACAFDPVRQRVVLHGGAGSSDLLGDTWEWDGTTWTSMPGRSPTPRSGHSLAYDVANASMLLAGGGTGDLWERRGTEWVRLTEPAPTPRGHAMMTYDSVRQRAVLFGGAALYAENFFDTSNTVTTYPNDTWERGSRAPVPAPTTAYAIPFGTGCGASSMRVEPLAGWRPYVGGSLRAVVTRTPQFANPPPPTFLAFGTAASIPGLPLPLDFLGFTGCRLWHNADLALDVRCVSTPAGDSLSIALPNSAAFLGVHVYGQAWGLDWNTFPNSAFVAGGAIDWQIGNW